jgi:hypothetical protein
MTVSELPREKTEKERGRRVYFFFRPHGHCIVHEEGLERKIHQDKIGFGEWELLVSVFAARSTLPGILWQRTVSSMRFLFFHERIGTDQTQLAL